MKKLRLRDSRQFPPTAIFPGSSRSTGVHLPAVSGVLFFPHRGTQHTASHLPADPSVFRRGSRPPLHPQHVAQFPTHCGLSARAACSKSVGESRLVVSFHHCQDDSFC